MNKKRILWILLDLVFLIIFNTIFFLLGGVHNKSSVWVAYGFIHFSYIMLLFTPSLCKRRTEQIEMRLSVDSVSLLYFWVTFVIGVVFIIVKPDICKSKISVIMVPKNFVKEIGMVSTRQVHFTLF